MKRFFIPVSTLIIGMLLLILWYMFSVLEVLSRGDVAIQPQIDKIIDPVIYIGWANIATTLMFVVLGGLAYVAGKEKIRKIDSVLDKWIYLCFAGSFYGIYLVFSIVFVVCGC